MDQHRIDALTRSLSRVPSRRDVLRGLAVAALGLGMTRWPEAAETKKRKNTKARPNTFGCLDVGDRCQRAGQCCSGLCQGKKGKKRCRAHDTGNCQAGNATTICGGVEVPCTTSLGKPGVCVTTTGNAAYCQAAVYQFGCKTDVDCQVVAGGILGTRAACVRCTAGTLDVNCARPADLETM